MDSENRGSLESSSEEERPEQKEKRSYECNFCKRGFTNAQALGGHMNIHRKDRTNKVKQLHNNFQDKDSLSPSISTQRAIFYPILEAQRAQRACFQTSDPNPNPRRHPQYDHHIGSDHGRLLELLGGNLSLGRDQMEMESTDSMKMFVRKEDEVDLELRLGLHHP